MMFRGFRRTLTEPKRELRPRLLPVTTQEFVTWSIRIMDLADLSKVDRVDQQFSLAGALIKLPPDKAMETDEYFIFILRKLAVDAVAVDVRQKIYETRVAEHNKVALLPNAQSTVIH